MLTFKYNVNLHCSLGVSDGDVIALVENNKWTIWACNWNFEGKVPLWHVYFYEIYHRQNVALARMGALGGLWYSAMWKQSTPI